MADEMNGEREALGFVLEERGSIWVVQFDEGGCRPATIPEKVLWDNFQAGRASLAASAGSEPVAEIGSAAGDDAEFGQRAIYPLVDIDHLEYGTKLYTHPSPPEGMAGWKLVPVHPTPEMWNAARSVPDPNPPYPPHYGLVWDAMISAAPPLPASEAKEL
jgi:hypothetical protein